MALCIQKDGGFLQFTEVIYKSPTNTEIAKAELVELQQGEASGHLVFGHLNA